MSRRQTVREAWKAQVETAGYPVGMGEVPTLGPDDAEQAVVLVFTDAVSAQGHKKFHETTVDICALAKADLDEPWVALEEMVAALKAAVETTDHTVAGILVEPVSERDLEREPGSTVVGTVLSYRFRWQERWGAP